MKTNLFIIDMRHKFHTIVKFCICWFLILSPTILWAQFNLIHAPNNHLLNEKVVMVTDKDFYLIGESVYLAYLTYDEFSNRKLNLSSILYAEIISSENEIICQGKHFIQAGLGNGYLQIPKQIKSGTYYLRVYTNYMKNFGSNQFTIKPITIINPLLATTISSKKELFSDENHKNTIRVFPLAKFITPNQLNKLTFHTTQLNNTTNQGILKIKTKTGNIVYQLPIDAYGFATCTFTPSPFTNYILEYSDGTNTIVDTLFIKDKTQIINVVDKDQDKLILNITIQDSKKSEYRLVYIKNKLAVTLDTIYYSDSNYLVPFKNLPTGINQIQLINIMDSVMAYANVFIPFPKEEELSIKTNKMVYASREPIEMDLESSIDNLFSVSVTLIDSAYLTSHPNPNYPYLWNDLYMLGQYSNLPISTISINPKLFENILATFPIAQAVAPNNNQITFLPEINNDIISGQFIDNGLPKNDVTITQSFVDSVCHLETFKTKNNGNYYFYAQKNQDNNTLVLMHNAEDSGKIILQNEFYDEYLNITNENFNGDILDVETIKSMFYILQINDAYKDSINENQTKIEPKQSFYGNAERTLYIKDFVLLTTLEEFLFEVFPWVMSKKSAIRILYKGSSREIGPNPLLLLDGIPVMNHELLLNLKCSDLYSVSAVYTKFFYQNCYYDGILDVKSKEGKGNLIDPTENCLLIKFLGVQNLVHSNRIPNDSISTWEPNFKNQLFWLPVDSIKANKSIKKTFTAPDNTGLFQIKATIMRPDGTTTNTTKIIQVKN